MSPEDDHPDVDRAIAHESGARVSVIPEPDEQPRRRGGDAYSSEADERARNRISRLSDEFVRDEDGTLIPASNCWVEK